jgi:hypothetical protein
MQKGAHQVKKNFPGLGLIMAALTLSVFAGGAEAFQRDETAEVKKWMKTFPLSGNAKELSFLWSFPSPDSEKNENYLWQPRQFRFDESGAIFVLDNKWKCVFKFNSKGEFVKKAGREGQGPGEFANPYGFCLDKNHIYISDTNRREIQVFDKDMVFSRSFRVAKSYISFAVTKDGFFVGAPFRMTPDTPLIDVLDGSGKLLYSFAPGLFGNARSWMINNFVFVEVNDHNEVLCAFRHYPTVCKFDIKGKLLFRYEIKNKFMNSIKKQNDDRLSDPDNQVFFTAIHGIRAQNGGFFLLTGPYTNILEFDEKGKQVAEYWTVRSSDYRVEDFFVKIDRVFTLVSAPRAVIEVFQPKESADTPFRNRK